MTDATHPAVQRVIDLSEDRKKALDLLEGFCERFYWVKDHPEEMRKFLTLRGRDPRGIG